MFKEKRVVYRGPETSHEDDMESEVIAANDNNERIDPDAQECAKGLAEIMAGVETGNWAEASKAFYKTFLETPEKMMHYRDLMMMSTTPITWFTRNIPVVGLMAKAQIKVSDEIIRKVFGLVDRYKDSDAAKLLTKVEGEWDKLSDEDKDAVSGLLENCVKGNSLPEAA